VTTEGLLAARAEEIWFAYSQERWVLKGLSVEVPKGAFITVLGPSGAGKTTLLKLLAGLLRPQRGSVELLGHGIEKGVPRGLRERVGYIPQQLGLVRSMTALENVLMGALGRRRGLLPLLGIFPKKDVEAAKEWLALLDIPDKADEKVYRLSGGERQRVAIARTLLQNPSVVFADEFVSDLDLPRAAEILMTMRKIGEQRGLTLVCNMHELPLVKEFGGTAVIVRDGSILPLGSAQNLTRSLLEGAATT